MNPGGIIIGETDTEDRIIMLNSIQVVGGSVLTLFLLMAVGFFFVKKGILTKDALPQMSRLLLYVVAPCIMINTFVGEECNWETVRSMLIAGGVLVGTYVLNMLLIHPWFRRATPDDRGALRFASIYGNTGFMGIPLIQAVLGNAGMMPTVISLAVFNISTWTHGNVLIGGRKQLSVKKAFLNPGVIGFAIAVILFALRVKLPGPVTSTLGFLGNLNTPLAMVIIGGQMAAVDFRELFRDWRLYVVSAVKLLAVPAITMLVMLPLHLDPITYMAVTILSACPVAGATSLFSQMNGKDPSLAARLVTLSTLFCIITLPLVSAVAGLLCGM